AAVASLVLSAPASATAGTGFSVTVTAKDAFSNTVTTYTGTAHFTSSDGQAVLPANYPFVAADGGAHSFSGVILKTAGPQTLSVSDGTRSATQTVTVSAAALASITVTPSPASIQAGQSQTFTAAGADQYGNAVTITPTWSASSSDAGCANSATCSPTKAGTYTVTATSGAVSGGATL